MVESNSMKGKVKEVLGAVTGDRQVEAEGRAEEKVARPDLPVDELSSEVVDEEHQSVRKDHGDI